MTIYLVKTTDDQGHFWFEKGIWTTKAAAEGKLREIKFGHEQVGYTHLKSEVTKFREIKK